MFCGGWLCGLSGRIVKIGLTGVEVGAVAAIKSEQEQTVGRMIVLLQLFN